MSIPIVWKMSLDIGFAAAAVIWCIFWFARSAGKSRTTWGGVVESWIDEVAERKVQEGGQDRKMFANGLTKEQEKLIAKTLQDWIGLVSASISAALWFSALISKLIKWDAWGLSPCFEDFWGVGCSLSARVVVIKSCGGILLVLLVIVALASTMRMLSIAMFEMTGAEPGNRAYLREAKKQMRGATYLFSIGTRLLYLLLAAAFFPFGWEATVIASLMYMIVTYIIELCRDRTSDLIGSNDRACTQSHNHDTKKWTVVGILPPLLVSAGVSAVLFLPLLRSDAMSAWGSMRNWWLECGSFVALGIFEGCNFLRKDPLPWDITHHLRGAFRTWARTHTVTEQRGLSGNLDVLGAFGKTQSQKTSLGLSLAALFVSMAGGMVDGRSMLDPSKPATYMTLSRCIQDSNNQHREGALSDFLQFSKLLIVAMLLLVVVIFIVESCRLALLTTFLLGVKKNKSGNLYTAWCIEKIFTKMSDYYSAATHQTYLVPILVAWVYGTWPLVGAVTAYIIMGMALAHEVDSHTSPDDATSALPHRDANGGDAKSRGVKELTEKSALLPTSVQC